MTKKNNINIEFLKSQMKILYKLVLNLLFDNGIVQLTELFQHLSIFYIQTTKRHMSDCCLYDKNYSFEILYIQIK